MYQYIFSKQLSQNVTSKDIRKCENVAGKKNIDLWLSLKVDIESSLIKSYMYKQSKSI